jgi:hypothetical protein
MACRVAVYSIARPGDSEVGHSPQIEMLVKQLAKRCEGRSCPGPVLGSHRSGGWTR